MKKFAIVGMVLLVTGVLGTTFHWHDLMNLNSGEMVEQTLTINNDQINTIDVESDVAEVNFYPADEEAIQIDFSGNNVSDIDDLLTVDESDHTLFITIKHKSRFLNISFLSSWFNRNQVLNVGLPESFTGSIETAVDVGSIQIDDLTIDQFNGLVNVGSITGSNIDLNQASAEIDVGEVNLRGVTGEWYLATDVGEIKLVHLDWQGKIEAHSDIGDILIRVAEEPEHYTLSLDTELGSVKGVEHSYIESRSQPDAPRLEASSDIGDIRLEWGR